MTSIAKAYGTTVSAIATANNISNPDYIYVGEVLTIGSSTSTSTSTSSTSSSSTSSSSKSYTVASGDILLRLVLPVVVQRRVLLRAIPSLLEIL